MLSERRINLQGTTPDDRTLKTAAVLACVLGIAATVIFLYTGQGSYSSLYLVPDKISVDASHQGVFFVYGVKSLEKKTSAYTLDIYAGDVLVHSKQFSLDRSQSLEEGVHVDLPRGTTFPVRISLNLTGSRTANEVHFWVQ